MFGGWSIDEALYSTIEKIIPHGSSILELGSGCGSSELGKYYEMTCIEHDDRWMNKFPNINYVKASIMEYKPTPWTASQNQWYDKTVVKPLLKDSHYDLLLIDGPPGNIGRGGILKYRDLIANVPIIVDDSHRSAEWRIAVILSRYLKRPIYTPEPEIKKQFSIIAERELICSIVSGQP